MGKCGAVITLELMKGAAFHHGLAKLVEGEIDISKLFFYSVKFKKVFLLLIGELKLRDRFWEKSVTIDVLGLVDTPYISPPP